MSVRFAEPVAVRVLNGRRLWLEGNSKITAGNGSFDEPAPNSFSLIHVADCPGSTPTCRASCYVHGLEVHEPAVHALYRENSATIREILTLPRSNWVLAGSAVAHHIERFAAAGFRWHVSGDIFSLAYAEWIACVVRMSPSVNHWIYTRSFDLIGPLLELPNLALNLSCDRDNYRQASFTRGMAAIAGRSIPPRLAYLSAGGEVPPNLPEGSVIFPDYQLRGRDLERPTEAPWWTSLTPRERKMVCPVDFFGASSSMRCGPCKKCLKP